MSATDTKTSVKAILDGVPGIGAVDAERIDPDDVPRKLRGTVPYWAISVYGIRDEDVGLGSNDSKRALRRDYMVTIEGWRGIVATASASADWDALVESVINRLQTSMGILAATCHFRKWEQMEVTRIDVWEHGNTRAHHAVITAQMQTYQVVS